MDESAIQRYSSLLSKTKTLYLFLKKFYFMKCGFLPLSQTHLLAGDVTSHPYGPAATVPECREMATSMGNSDI